MINDGDGTLAEPGDTVQVCEQLALPGLTWRERNEWERRRAEYDEIAERMKATHEWLRGAQRWEWFATFTFAPREDGSDHALAFCQRALDRLLEELGRAAGYTRRETRTGHALRGFLAWERHKSGRWHAHALIAGARSLHWRVAKEIAYDRLGIARIYPIEGEDEGAKERMTKYVAKYTAKGPDWDCFGDWSADDQLPLPLVHDEHQGVGREATADAVAGRVA